MRCFISIVLIVVMIGFSPLAKAQDADNCVKTLAPCTEFIYMPKMKPSDDCCKPLAEALTSALPCVCSIYGDGPFMKSMGVDAKAALSLPMRCGIKVDLASACLGALTPASVPSSSPTSTPTKDNSLSPDGTPATDEDSSSPAGAPTTTVTTTLAPSGSKNAASNIAMSGFAVISSFLMWATIMFY